MLTQLRISSISGPREAELHASALLLAALKNGETKRQDGPPTDQALIAREWVTASVPTPTDDGYLSFSECCAVVGLDAHEQRARLVGWFHDRNDFLSESSLDRSLVLRWIARSQGLPAAMPELGEVADLLWASLHQVQPEAA